MEQKYISTAFSITKEMAQLTTTILYSETDNLIMGKSNVYVLDEFKKCWKLDDVYAFF